MILKIIEAIAQRRNLVLSILALPVIAIFFLSNYRVVVTDHSPYISYDITFHVPSTTASFIEDKVTIEAEKSFNGLPNLLSIDSRTTHEKCIIELMFNKGSESDKALLFIQEKMDRLKLVLPSEVSNITIIDKKRTILPDITIKGGNVRADQLVKALRLYRDMIKKVEPEIKSEVKIRLLVDSLSLTKLNIPVDQLWKALKLEGISYRLGRDKDIFYILHPNYHTIEQLKAIPIGVYGNRPVRLNEVGKLIVELPNLPTDTKIWLNKDRISTLRFAKELKAELPILNIEKTYISHWLKFFAKYGPILAIIIALQLLFFTITFRSRKAIASALIFDVLLFGHYFFWIGIIRNEISIIDMTGFLLTLLVGTIYWAVLLFRIRMYFIRSQLPSFIQRTLAQASLFSIAEYLPTFSILSGLTILFSFPFIISDINTISQQIILRYLFYGIPITLILLSFLPIISPLSWIKTDVHLEHPSSKFNIPISPNWFWPILICFISSLYLWKSLPLGIDRVQQEHIPQGLEVSRGHGSALPYNTDKISGTPELKHDLKRGIDKNWVIQWMPTATSMMNLGNYDIAQFQEALSDLAHNIKWGALGENGSEIPISYSNNSISKDQFANLLLSSKKDKTKHIRAGLIFGPKVKLINSQIFHSQLERTNRVVLTKNYSKGNLTKAPPLEVYPAAITKNWKTHYKSYLKSKWIVLVFTFILISLYMNSFVRGALLTITSFSVELLLIISKMVMNSPFHLDSLWFIWLPSWFTLFIILILSRVTDVERLRGNDRDLVLKENEQYFATVTKWSYLFVAISLIILSLGDLIPMGATSGLPAEGIIIGTIGIIVGFVTYFYLFKLFYIAEDELYEEFTYHVMKVARRFKIIK